MKIKAMISTFTVLLLTACGGNGDEAMSADQAKTVADGAKVALASKTTKELNIYNWSDYVDPATVAEFEKQYNTQVRYDYYDSNETLEAKILTGRSGYDLVVPSSGSIARQIKAGAYEKIDKTLIPNYANISPKLLKLMDSVDPGNEYAVPYFLGTNTIGVNVEAVDKALGGVWPKDGWDLVFNPEYTHKLKSCGITFLDSPSEIFPLALHYLGKPLTNVTKEDLQEAADLMLKVRPDIKRFSSSGYINDLARGDLCVVVGYSGDINIAAMRAKEAKAAFAIKALMPKSGVGIWVDSFMIPKNAEHRDSAHQYINYTLAPDVAARNGNYVTYAPASAPAQAKMKPEIANNPSIFPSDEAMDAAFIIQPFSLKGIKISVRLWQQLKAGA